MPDDDDDLQYDDDDSSVIKVLRGKAKRTDAAESEAALLRTENALLKAGLDLTPKQTTAVLAAHEGDMDPASLRATATELGILREEEPPDQQVSAEEQAALDADPTAEGPPADAAEETLIDRINAARNQDELDSIMAEAGMLGIAE